MAKPDPGHWAILFYSTLRPDVVGYEELAERMVFLAQQQPGYRGHFSCRGEDRRGLTISYWSSREAIRAWREHPEHKQARSQWERFYEDWRLETSRIDSIRGRSTREDSA